MVQKSLYVNTPKQNERVADMHLSWVKSVENETRFKYGATLCDQHDETCLMGAGCGGCWYVKLHAKHHQ